MAKTAWSQSGTVTPGKGQSVPLQAQFVETGNYTIQFGIVGADESGAASVRKTRAYITWSVEGNDVTRIIDVVNGTSITGTAQAVTVEVKDESSGGGGANKLKPYVITIQIAKGTRGDTQQPPYYSQPLVTLPAGYSAGGVAVPVGAGATSVKVSIVPSLIGDVLNTWDYQVEFKGSSSYLKGYNPLVDPGWVPLPSGTTTIRFTQAAGAPTTYWFVSFGIDG